MDRRNFLKVLGSSIAGATLLRKNAFAASSESSNADSRVLVIVDLNGGNDGLNTVVPLKQYDDLASYRPELMIPKNQLLNLDDETAFHPSLSGMKGLYDQGNLAVVQGVSYPVPNMSHFRSSEIIWSGSGSGDYLETGWLGRFLDEEHPEFPVGYPNVINADPMVVAFHSNPTLIFQGDGSNYASVTKNAKRLEDFRKDEFSTDPAPEGRYGEELNFLRTQMTLTLDYNQAIYDRYQMSPQIDEQKGFARDFEQVMNLIKSGSQTKVYVVSLGGFDTHGGQVVDGDPTLGTHADLLAELDLAISSFVSSLQEQGLLDRVVGLVGTEFGRRIMANDSLGTDHGHASPWFVFGDKVNGSVIGDSNVLPDAVDIESNVPMQHDFRDIYTTILNEWFEIPLGRSTGFFDHSYQPVPLFDKTVSKLPGVDNRFVDVVQLDINEKIIHIENPGQHSEAGVFQILDLRGKVVYSLRLELRSGQNSVRLRGMSLSPGRYFMNVRTPEVNHSEPLSVLR